MKLTNEQIIDIASKNRIVVREDSLTRNESGLDFLVVFATDVHGEKWILRFPRREDVMQATMKEKQTLDIVGSKLSVQAPSWIVHTDELIAYKRLEGVPVGTIDQEAKAYVWEIDPNNVPELLNQSFAKALVSLHQISEQDARRANLQVESAEEVRRSMLRRMEKVKEAFDVNEELWNRWQVWISNESIWPQQTGLVHGDLHAGHILMDEQARVTGFIDWTEASYTDIANDFVPHYRTFGESALEELVKYYEQAGGYVWSGMVKHVIELTATYPIAIAEFAIKSGIEEYQQMAKHLLSMKD